MSHLLILSVASGSEDAFSAEALRATALALPEPPRVTHVDAMQYLPASFLKLYGEFHLRLAKVRARPWLLVPEKTVLDSHDAAARHVWRAIERVSSAALLRALRAARPDQVICTHFLPAEMMLRESVQSRIDCPVWLQTTDYDLHGLWLLPGAAGYFVAHEEGAHRMRSCGLPAPRIHVTGLPVMPGFSDPQSPALERAACRQSLGLLNDKPVILVVSNGVDGLSGLLARMLEWPAEFQVLAVTEDSAERKAALESIARQSPGRSLLFGSPGQKPSLMAAADLVVTRPGGSTLSECLALGRPMLLASLVPGQEEHSAGFLVEHGAAWMADDEVGMDYKVGRLLSEPMQLAAMAAHGRRLGQARAAQAVLEHVLGRRIERV